jgi:hypothetical protein
MEVYDMTFYNPKIVLWQMNPLLLKAFFEHKGYPLDIVWGEMNEAQIQKIHDAFLKLPDSAQQNIETDLQDVHTIASTEDGISILIEQAVFMGFHVAGELERIDSRYDKAMVVLLCYPEVWNKAVTLVHANNLSKRCWYRRSALPKQPPDTSELAMEKLGHDISAFYWQSQGRGQHCHIDHIQRSENQDYFFAYLSDHTDTDLTWDDAGKILRVRRRCAFEVVFVFDRSEGTLDVFAHGGENVIEPLEKIFTKAILGVDLDLEDPEIPYRIEGLKDRSFQLTTEPEDGVSQVAVCMLRMHPLGNKTNKLTIKLPSDAGPDEIYNWLDDKLDTTKLPLSVLRIERATISMKLQGYGPKKSLTFEIGPESCTLESEPEPLRRLGEKYIHKWGLDHVEQIA